MSFRMHSNYKLNPVVNYLKSNQDLSEQIFKNKIRQGKISNNITLVTAFYIIKSKYPSSKYIEWIDNFMLLNCNLVIFTDKESENMFKKYSETKKNLKIIILEIKDFYTSKWDSYWNYCYEIDREKNVGHTVELYKIYNEKPYLLKNVSDLNPFNSDYFFWVDIGSIRERDSLESIKNFPDYDKLNKIPLDKFIIIAIYSHNNEDYNLVNGISPIYQLDEKGKLSPDPVKCARIQGGFFGGNRQNIDTFFKLYYEELDFFKTNELYGGKDQYIIGNLYLKNKEFFNMLEKEIYIINNKETDKWFSYLFRFS